jgi:hypothetical protein
MTASSQSHLALLLRMRTRPDAQQDNPTVMQDRLDVLPLGVTSFFRFYLFTRKIRTGFTILSQPETYLDLIRCARYRQNISIPRYFWPGRAEFCKEGITQGAQSSPVLFIN